MPQQIAGGNLQQWKKPLPDGTIGARRVQPGRLDDQHHGRLRQPRPRRRRQPCAIWSGPRRARRLHRQLDGDQRARARLAPGPRHGAGRATASPATPSAPASTAAARSAAAMDVAFGAQGTYVFRAASAGSVACSNGTLRRRSGLRLAPRAATCARTGGGGPAGFVYCAGEGGSCCAERRRRRGLRRRRPVPTYQAAASAAASAATTARSAAIRPYGWTKACYTRPSGGGVAYEAEAAHLGGSASVAGCSGCAGGKKVGYIGAGGGRVTLPQVDVATSGAHQLDHPRRLGRSAHASTSASTAAPACRWPSRAAAGRRRPTATMTLPLGRGINTHRASTTTAQYAPDLDRVVVE